MTSFHMQLPELPIYHTNNRHIFAGAFPPPLYPLDYEIYIVKAIFVTAVYKYLDNFVLKEHYNYPFSTCCLKLMLFITSM